MRTLSRHLSPTVKSRSLAAPLDLIGALLSSLCAVHCLVMPFIAVLLPVFGIGFLASRGFERTTSVAMAVLATLCVVTGCQRHGRWWLLALLGAGATLTLGTQFSFIASDCIETCCNRPGVNWSQAIVMFAGGGLVAASHLLNLRFRRDCACCANSNETPVRTAQTTSWRSAVVVLLALPLSALSQSATAAEPLRVVVTSTDVASLAREIGGDRVRVVCLSQGPEDPHTIEVKPGFVRELNQAHLFIQVGLGLENAWLKDLLARVKNPDLKPGGAANLNLGRGVRPLKEVAGLGVAGGFHEEGNPHYLLDPFEGLKAAKTICDRFAEMRPLWRDDFERRHEAFHQKLATALVGEECASDADFEEVVLQFERAKTKAELDALLQQHDLGGWLKAFLPYRGQAIVGDHDLWPYFARRYGLEILDYLEPSPGVPPTTKHLQSLVGRMKEAKIRVILTAPYFDARHARFVANRTGANILSMAHQTGARKSTDDYIAMLRFNAEQLLQALQKETK